MKKLKSHNVDRAQIERYLASADRRLESAHKILAFDDEACLQQAYEAMLRGFVGVYVQPRLPAKEPAGAITLRSSNSFVGESTPSTPACSPSSTVFDESGTWLSMTIRDSSRTTKQRKPWKQRGTS